MAVSLSIKNVPDEWVEQLRARAASNHRSLQGELMAILEESLVRRRLTVEDVYRRVREIGLATPAESVEILREERDAR
jgi:plasmid stability protein